MKVFLFQGKKVLYKEFGEGQIILLLHGWGGSSESLYNLGLELSKSYKVIIPDLPGFGKSDMPEKDWGIEEYSQCIVELTKSLSQSPIILFGHSFGGAVSLFLARKYPEVVEKLIVCAPSYKREKKQKNEKEHSSAVELLKKALFPVRYVKYKLFHRNSDLMKVPKLEPNYKKIISQDLTPLMKGIKTKTLIIGGGQDKDVPLWHLEELSSLIADSKLKIYPDSTHGLPLKDPRSVALDITNFK